MSAILRPGGESGDMRDSLLLSLLLLSNEWSENSRPDFPISFWWSLRSLFLLFSSDCLDWSDPARPGGKMKPSSSLLDSRGMDLTSLSRGITRGFTVRSFLSWKVGERGVSDPATGDEGERPSRSEDKPLLSPHLSPSNC